MLNDPDLGERVRGPALGACKSVLQVRTRNGSIEALGTLRWYPTTTEAGRGRVRMAPVFQRESKLVSAQVKLGSGDALAPNQWIAVPWGVPLIVIQGSNALASLYCRSTIT